MSQLVRYETDNDVAVITMDDGKANALSFQMIAEIRAAFGRARQEGRAVVFSGRKGFFSAGLDLKVMQSGAEGVKGMLEAFLDLALHIYLFERPVVVACAGHALAGGAVLLLCADTRIGEEGDHKIGLTEVAVGLAMPGSVGVLANERLSRRYASRAVLEAEVFNPAAARDAGFLDRVAAPGEAVKEAIAHAARLAALPRGPFADTKAMLRARKAEEAMAVFKAELPALKAFRS